MSHPSIVPNNDKHSESYNFFFEPLKGDSEAKKAASVATNIILTCSTLGLWQAIFWSVRSINKIEKEPEIVEHLSFEEKIISTVKKSPRFDEYKIAKGTKFETILTGAALRPANLFFQQLFKGTPITTTLPESEKLFAFSDPEAVRKHIFSHKPTDIVSFSAKGIKSKVIKEDDEAVFVSDLKTIYGEKTYRISYGEIQSTLESQKIYLSSSLPINFYLGLKKAMIHDGIVTLPGDDDTPRVLRYLNTKNCKAFLEEAKNNFKELGFQTEEDLNFLLDLTLYQLGSMVVKTEDFHIFMDSNGHIIERKPGKKDSIQLINACGIRGIKNRDSVINKKIMTETFTLALSAAKNGIVIIPAVGMGVWGGDPNIYWRAFLDALLLSGKELKQVFINPGHQQTQYGPYRRCTGNELETIIGENIEKCKKEHDEEGVKQLSKIVNLYDQKTDIVHLAYNLKEAFPDEIISLFNASDPDVTLGNHVGEYVNNCPHNSTTEENYTAMGTNGLCFEQITKVHEDPKRVIKL